MSAASETLPASPRERRRMDTRTANLLGHQRPPNAKPLPQWKWLWKRFQKSSHNPFCISLLVLCSVSQGSFSERQESLSFCSFKCLLFPMENVLLS